MPKSKESEEEKKAIEKQEEDERNNVQRSERLGMLLSKESHQREQDWLDYEVEDTQVRFDLADMILEELADEVTQFLIHNSQKTSFHRYHSRNKFSKLDPCYKSTSKNLNLDSLLFLVRYKIHIEWNHHQLIQGLSN